MSAAIRSTLAAAVEEQGSVTGEITRNVEQAAQGTEDVVCSMGSAAEGSSETNTSADRLKTEVDSFLRQMKAA
ncbi:MAG: hypothetical protein ACR2PO_17000 [Methyloligellaceae bacterium]